ncbi:MAG: glycosyltransferase family 2 protein [Chloroflexia bacterium]|nr:glycosyltransferase family 2 protein [Chloroflexia bacterium]
MRSAPLLLPLPVECCSVPDLAVLVVSWNVRELLAGCLRSVQASLAGAGLSARLLVVDNASCDGSAAMVRQTFPEVQVLALEENRGFAGGSNAGLAELGLFTPPRSAEIGTPLSGGAVGEDACPPYVLLLNPDVEVPPGAIATMRSYLAAHPQVGLVGPQLRYPDGRPQSSRRRFPRPGTLFWESTPLERLWPRNPWVRHYRLEDRPSEIPQEVDWLVGACLLLRTEALRQVGSLDEGFFLYFEELEWCQRIQQAGWRVVYLPQVEVVHYEGRSSEQVPLQRQLYFERSKLRYARLRFGPAWAGLLRGFLLTMYAWQWLLEAGKWLLGHRRALRAQRMQVYGRILRTGLRGKV